MYESTLMQFGLTKNEAIVYLALLDLGKTTTGSLIKKTNIPSSKIYILLASLSEKGIVGYISEGKIRKYFANRPETLYHLTDLQEQKIHESRLTLTKLLPSLNSRFDLEPSNEKVEVFEGLRGIKSIYDLSLDVLKKGECMYTFGYPRLASELLNAYFEQYHKKIQNKGVVAKVIYDYDAWFWKKRSSRPLVEQRYLPKGLHTPGFVHIVKDYVAIIVVTSNQKTAVLIKNKDVAQSYLEYFKLIWNESMPI